jgi:bacteriorhodopsin
MPAIANANALIARGNEALVLNPPTGLDIHITTHGSDWYWAAFSFFALTAGAIFFVAVLTRSSNERLFHNNAVATLFFFCIGYYTMASDLGWHGIQAEFNHQTVTPSSVIPGIRQIFYTRYIVWFLAFPTFLGSLAVLAAVPLANILFTLVTMEVWVITLLIGSLIQSDYKWGYFTFACVAYLVVAYQLLFSWRRAGNDVDSETGMTTTITGVGIVFLLFIYPICWGLSEGGNVITPDSEAVFYGVLDICTFIFLQGFFLYRVRNVDFVTLGISPPNKPLFHAEKDARYSGDTAVSGFTQSAMAPAPEPVVAMPAEPAVAAQV